VSSRATLVPAVLALSVALLAGCGGEAPAATPAPSSGGAITIPPNLDEVIASHNAAAPTKVPEGKDRRVIGADVSWPQCPEGMGIPERRSEGAPMPREDAEFVVFGLTNGPSHTMNPCLPGQVAWARERGLMASAYAVVSYPTPDMLEQVRNDGPYDGTTRLGALGNAGHSAAEYAVGVMKGARLESPVVWIDVESVPGFDWSGDVRANQAVVKGAMRGFRDAGLDLGFYSTPTMWQKIVGDLSVDGAPEWRAAGQTSMAEALRRCSADASFGGGPAALGQWVEDGRDRNVTCPGQGGRLGQWFTRLT
jgi:hypothetical protein